jgi:hypothetical protein
LLASLLKPRFVCISHIYREDLMGEMREFEGVRGETADAEEE